MGKANGFLKAIGLVNKHPAVAFVGNIGTVLEVGKTAIDVAGSDAVKGFVGGAFNGAKKFLGIGVDGAPEETPDAPTSAAVVSGPSHPESTPIDTGTTPQRAAAQARAAATARAASNCNNLLTQQAIMLRQQYQMQLQQALAGGGQMPAFDPSLYSQFGMPDGSIGYYDPTMYPYGMPQQYDPYGGMTGVFGVDGLPPKKGADVAGADPTCTPCQRAAAAGAIVSGAGVTIVIGETAPAWQPPGETADSGTWVSGYWSGDHYYTDSGYPTDPPPAEHNASVQQGIDAANQALSTFPGYVPGGDRDPLAHRGAASRRRDANQKRAWSWRRRGSEVPSDAAQRSTTRQTATRSRSPRGAAASRVIDSVRQGYDSRIANLRRQLAAARAANRDDAVTELESMVQSLLAQSNAAQNAQNMLGLDTPEAQSLQAQIVLLARQDPAQLPNIFAQLVPQAPWGAQQPVYAQPAPWGYAPALQPNVVPMQSGYPVALTQNMDPMWQATPGTELSPYGDSWGSGDYGDYSDTSWDDLVAQSFPGVAGAGASLEEIGDSIQAAGVADDLATLSKYGMNFDIPADVDTQAAACDTGACPRW